MADATDRLTPPFTNEAEDLLIDDSEHFAMAKASWEAAHADDEEPEPDDDEPEPDDDDDGA